MGTRMNERGRRTWIDFLSDEDLQFLKRFLLSSGTLKDLASQYGVSYPTIRLRLDRLIEKVKVIDADASGSPFESHLRALYADGKVDTDAFRTLLEEYRAEESNHASRVV